MPILTDSEEAKYAYLQKEGYGDLADSMRDSWIRAHETFEKLSKADLDSVYGPAITEDMRYGMKRAIADGDHTLVRSMHNLFLAIEKSKEGTATTRPKADSTKTVPFGLATFGLIGVVISATVFAVMVLIGSY